MAGIGSAFQGFFGQGAAPMGSTPRISASGDLSGGGYGPGSGIFSSFIRNGGLSGGYSNSLSAPTPMLPTMGTAIRGMFGGGGATIAPRPSTIGGIGSMLGGMAPGGRPMPSPMGAFGNALGAASGGGHVVGAWGQAHPEILAQRQAARRAARGVL